jgi:hypothetical protein
MNARIAADRSFAHTNGYGLHFFDVSTALACLTLLVFALFLFGAAAATLRRRTSIRKAA